MRSPLLPLTASLVLIGCLDVGGGPTDPTEIECAPITSTRVIERGDTVVTTSGLEYIDLALGAGPEIAACQRFAAHIEGWLVDGTSFVSTVEAEPAHFWPGVQNIPIGLAQGMIGMRVGGTRRLFVPPDLGFGPEDLLDESGQVVIPGWSAVVFEISVLQLLE